MQTLIQKLRKQRRKRQHVEILTTRIAELNNNIVKDVISGSDKLKLHNKAKLLLKYNRRLRLIIY